MNNLEEFIAMMTAAVIFMAGTAVLKGATKAVGLILAGL